MSQTPILITSAGMLRSASTWLYNAIRLLVSRQPDMASDFSCGWIDDRDKIQKKRYMLLKAHVFDQNLVNESSIVFYSYRDVRDAIASHQRKFGGIASLKWADHFIETHERWIRVADFSMKYESMLHGKESMIVDIANALSAKQIISYDRNNGVIDPVEIAEELDNLNYDSDGNRNNYYNELNLLHKGHITDGRHGSWKECLNSELAAVIADKYSWWFEKYGYPI